MLSFYYGGSSRGAIARLQLKLDGLTKVDPTPETPKDDEDKKMKKILLVLQKMEHIV